MKAGMGLEKLLQLVLVCGLEGMDERGEEMLWEEQLVNFYVGIDWGGGALRKSMNQTHMGRRVCNGTSRARHQKFEVFICTLSFERLTIPQIIFPGYQPGTELWRSGKLRGSRGIIGRRTVVGVQAS